jgi:putative peptidoglycan lipid II flippase
MARPPSDRASTADPAVAAVPGPDSGANDVGSGSDAAAAAFPSDAGYREVASGSVADDMAAEGGDSARAAVSVRSGFAGAAALIAGITILSRIIGFGRTLLLGHVAQPRLGQAYLTANTIPNIIFEIIAGGALAALVVPLVAGAIARSDRAEIGRTASAMLTWVLAILVPLAVLVAVFARPIITFAINQDAKPATIAVGAGMLRVFAPQIPLYGIGIVLAGLLQAHRRFAWPVLAPLFSSVVVIATYITYRLVAPPAPTDIPNVPEHSWMILAVGTTLGVVVLSLCLIIPVARLGLRWSPTFRFTGDARRTVGGLAGVAIVTVAAQQIALFIAVRLANGASSVALYTFTVAQTVYLVPWSVLALPVAMSVYPGLATSSATGDDDGYRRMLATATRTVTLLSAFGAAALIAAATPLGRLFAAIADSTRPDPGVLALTFATFAPGLVGYGLFALHSRALYARSQNRYAAIATIAGWGTVVVASFVLAALMPVHFRPAALTTANTIGMTVLAIVLGVIVAARTGRGSLQGLTRAGLAAIAAGAAAAVAGITVRQPLPDHPGWLGDIGQGMLSGAVAVVVFGLVAAAIDRPDLALIVRRMRRRRSPSTATTAADIRQ